jgi:hypothetical protein
MATRRRLVWVVGAAVLVGALVVTGRLLDTGAATRAPAATAGSAGQTGTTGRPAAPAGAVQVEGVSLVPTGPAFRTSCRRAADRLGFAVPCPELLPVPSSGPALAGLCQGEGVCQSGLLWFPMEAFVVPDGFTGAPGSLGALVVLATPDEQAAAAMARWCPDQRPLAAPGPGGRPTVLGACPAGFYGWSTGSVLLRWTQAGTHLTLALRGQSEGNRRLLVALARSLRLVRSG